MSLLEYNKNTDVEGYNCGGFALGCMEWYCPDQYDCGQSFTEMLYDCADDIEKDFPELTRIPHYNAVPKRFDVIGFRLAWQEGTESDEYPEGEPDDFHFVLRHKGHWYHKPGWKTIRKFKGNVEAPWPKSDGNFYDSDIVWFAKGLRK